MSGMQPKGWQDVLKKWPAGFAFLTFTAGVAAIVKLLAWLTGFDPLPLIKWGWVATPGLLGVVIIRHLFPSEAKTRDSDDCLDQCVYVVTSSKRLIDELYGQEDSVVKGARKFLYVMGSRSRDQPYLDAIEAQIKLRPELAHARILIGAPKNDLLFQHIAELEKFYDSRNVSNGDGPIKVCEYEIGGDVPERFIAVSETKAVVTLPSLNSLHGYDTALVIEDDIAAQKLGAILSSLAQSCPEVYVGKKR